MTKLPPTSVHKRGEGRGRGEKEKRENEERRRRRRLRGLLPLLTAPEFEVQGVLTESGCSLRSAPPRGSLKSGTMISF